MTNTHHKAILSLGSNLGDRTAWLKKAAKAINSLPETDITTRSSIYETEPLDVPKSFKDKSFLNAIVIIQTLLSATDLSNSIHNIEEQFQRKRETPNQPRTIDIDIITFDDLVSQDKELTLPHPRAHLRRFVLEPLAELLPESTLPGTTTTISTLLQSLPENPAVRLYREW